MKFRPKFYFPLFLITLGFYLEFSECCPLPLAAGDWYSSSRGTWTISTDGNNLINFRADLTAQSPVNNLTCDTAGTTSTQYILHTNFEIFFNVYIDVYTCLDIRSTDNPQKYLYYIVTPTDSATGETFTSDKASACSNTDYLIARNTHVLISKSSFDNATTGPQSVSNCPDVILGNYSVTFTKTDGSKLNDSLLDSCNDTTALKFSNNDATLKHAFSSQNEVYCLYSEQSGSEYYVHTFNNETSDETNEIYNFACWVFAYSADGVTGTAYPESCQQEQSSTEVQYGGQKFVFDPYVTCPLNVEEPVFPVWAIVLIVLGALLALIVIIILVVFLVFSRKKWPRDDEAGIIKDEEKRHPSPDSITGEKENMKRKEEDYDSGFEDRWKDPVKPVISMREREHTMDLVEVTREEELKESAPKGSERKLEPKDADLTRLKEPLPGPSDIQKDKQKLKEAEKSKREKEKEKSKVISPRDKKEQAKRKEAEKLKEAEKAKENSITPEPVPPPGKKTVHPTTPRPAADDTTLARIKKDDKKDGKKDKKEQTIRVEETIKEEPEESSSEYETDESERKERMQRLLEKRKRLAGAEYIPPDLADATVVGRKKRRKQRELDEMTKKLVSRDKQEEIDKALRERKKAMRRLARSKFRSATDGEESSDTEAEPKGKKSKYKSDTETGAKAKKSKRRKGGDQNFLEAPYTEQYHVKKHIEGELDAIDYWNLNPHSSPDFADDELELDLDKKHSPILHVQPISEPMQGTNEAPKLDVITQEEDDVWDQNKNEPLPGTLGFVGVELGPNGEVPKGFRKDEEGNVIRIADGAMISSGDIARQIELKRRLIFTLPRLIRNVEGRPLGGYKDDLYGPTAEWDYGVITDEGEGEDEADKKGKTSERTTSANRQVCFADDRSIPPTPLQDGDEYQKKGRHQTTAARELLKKRLFEESKAGKEKAGKENAGPDNHVPVYFVGGKEGIKPDSIYIDNAQITRPGGDLKPVNFQRSKSMRTPWRVVKSDAYDDGRAHLYREGLSKDKKILQNANVRRSLRQTGWTPREGIPEETGIRTNRSDVKRNLGSDDEFILVSGTLKKVPRPSDLIDDRLHGDMCPRYERHRYGPGREVSDISMRTADTRPFSGDDRRLRQVLGELYKDKKYFDYYLDTEALPTNAAVETRDLATHGRDFLLDVAEYWAERQPPRARPRPPRDTSLPLSRLPTTLTAADSGNDSMRSYTTDRPHTADDIQNMPVPPPRNRPSRENTLDSARETLPTARTGRTQLSDIASRQSETE